MLRLFCNTSEKWIDLQSKYRIQDKDAGQAYQS